MVSLANLNCIRTEKESFKGFRVYVCWIYITLSKGQKSTEVMYKCLCPGKQKNASSYHLEHRLYPPSLRWSTFDQQQLLNIYK